MAGDDQQQAQDGGQDAAARERGQQQEAAEQHGHRQGDGQGGAAAPPAAQVGDETGQLQRQQPAQHAGQFVGVDDAIHRAGDAAGQGQQEARPVEERKRRQPLRAHQADDAHQRAGQQHEGHDRPQAAPLAAEAHGPIEQGDAQEDAGDLRPADAQVIGHGQADAEHEQQQTHGQVIGRRRDEAAGGHLAHQPQERDDRQGQHRPAPGQHRHRDEQQEDEPFPSQQRLRELTQGRHECHRSWS